ncbi:MAG: aminoacyl-tRNA hydrolase [Phycisphaerae bacterium]
MKLIVGLGNPGTNYADTRHNVGFKVVDQLAQRCRADLTVEKFSAFFAKTQLTGQPVVLLKPTTFMNRSGRAIQAAGRFYKLELADLLVITDDMALPLGKLRLRSGGGAGGHNGMQDIINHLGSDQFSRLRIGIDSPVGDPVNFVLSRFGDQEQPVIDRACTQAADAAEAWVGHGIEYAMNNFNA